MIGCRLPKDVCAWLAGFVDGEGSLGVYRASNKKSLYARLTVVNTCFPVLRDIAAAVKCGSILSSVGPNRNAKRGYQFTLAKRDEIESILEKIVPYMKVKQRQAELVLLFCRDSREKELSEEDKQFYLSETASLNKKGVGGANDEQYLKEYREYLTSC